MLPTSDASARLSAAAAAVLYNSMIEETPPPHHSYLCATAGAAAAGALHALHLCRRENEECVHLLHLLPDVHRRRRRRPSGETECERHGQSPPLQRHTKMKYTASFSRLMTQQQFNSPLFAQQFATPCRRQRRRRWRHTLTRGRNFPVETRASSQRVVMTSISEGR